MSGKDLTFVTADCGWFNPLPEVTAKCGTSPAASRTKKAAIGFRSAGLAHRPRDNLSQRLPLPGMTIGVAIPASFLISFLAAT
ncbi:hypothetical protein [Pannonibacter sp.]|uniref:hypothetical protein n=1 Tax=Pannonibacter sp. TaxID=1906786 RepID=UPI003F70DC49